MKNYPGYHDGYYKSQKGNRHQKPQAENDYYFSLIDHAHNGTYDRLLMGDGKDDGQALGKRPRNYYEVRGLYDEYVLGDQGQGLSSYSQVGVPDRGSVDNSPADEYNVGKRSVPGLERCESFYGCVHTERDCFELITRARQGKIGVVMSRLNEKEKSIIRPGSLFIYSESASGILRWTDKKDWTPSRVQGVFLVYKELKGGLCKKTFTLRQSDQVWRLVAYTLLDWEENGSCCEYFAKQRESSGNVPLKVSEGEIVNTTKNKAQLGNEGDVPSHPSEEMVLNKIKCYDPAK